MQEEEQKSKTDDETIEEFFKVLLSNQEPLGEEFEKVLFENLWELYSRK